MSVRFCLFISLILVLLLACSVYFASQLSQSSKGEAAPSSLGRSAAKIWPATLPKEMPVLKTVPPTAAPMAKHGLITRLPFHEGNRASSAETAAPGGQANLDEGYSTAGSLNARNDGAPRTHGVYDPKENASRSPLGRGGVDPAKRLQADIQVEGRAPAMPSPLALPPVADQAQVIRSAAFVWPTAGTVSQHFGPEHRGIDIAAPLGTPVYAADAGIVVVQQSDQGWGSYIVIEHDNGYRTQYSHLSETLVSVGKTVERGQLIAKVGSSGWSTGPHLDFRIYLKNVAINPRDHLPK